MCAKILSHHDELQTQPLRITAPASRNSRSGTPEQLTDTLTRGGTNTPAPQAPGSQERRPEQHLVTASAPEKSEQLLVALTLTSQP